MSRGRPLSRRVAAVFFSLRITLHDHRVTRHTVFYGSTEKLAKLFLIVLLTILINFVLIRLNVNYVYKRHLDAIFVIEKRFQKQGVPIFFVVFVVLLYNFHYEWSDFYQTNAMHELIFAGSVTSLGW